MQHNVHDFYMYCWCLTELSCQISKSYNLQASVLILLYCIVKIAQVRKKSLIAFIFDHGTMMQDI